MQPSTLLVLALVAIVFAYYAGQSRAVSYSRAHSTRSLSLPFYHGSWLAILTVVPALLLLLIWGIVDGAVIKSLTLSSLPEPFSSASKQQKTLIYSEICRIAEGGGPETINAQALAGSAEAWQHMTDFSNRLRYGLALLLAIGGFAVGWFRYTAQSNVRVSFERTVLFALLACASIAVLTTVGIVFSVLFESMRFFDSISFFEFVFGTHWSPQISIREDQVGSTGAFGAVPLFVGTLLITAIAMVVAVPLGLMSAIYLSEYATPRFRSVAKPVLEILAGIPTVVYGFFAAITVAPLLRDLGDQFGLSVASESALAAGLVMGVMIIPFVSSLSDDVINAVPQSLRDGSLGLGATHSETIKQVVIPAALPGIVGGVLLAVSRAIGETMIVVMAAGLSANLTVNPFEAVTTVTVQIVTLLVGDQEFDSPKTLAAFALGLMLFVTTLVLNVIALYVVRKYREQYD